MERVVSPQKQRILHKRPIYDTGNIRRQERRWREGCEEAREEKKKDRIGGSVDKSGLSGHLLSFVLPAIFYHPFRPSFWGGNGSGPFSSRRCIGPTH